MTPQELLQEIEAVVAQMSEDDQVLWMRFTLNCRCYLKGNDSLYPDHVDVDWWSKDDENKLWSIYRRDSDMGWLVYGGSPKAHASIEAATKVLVERIRTEWPPLLEAQCKP